MKKITLTLVVGFLLSMNMIQAQDQKTFILGLNFSPSLDWMTPSTAKYSSEGVMLGYSYGIDLDFSIAHSPNYFIHTGIQLKRTGGRLNYSDSVMVNTSSVYTDVNRKYKIDYIRIPAAFKLKTNQFGRLTYYGMFGLDFDIRATAKANDEYSRLNPVTNVNNIKVNDDVSLFRAGLLVGAGAEYTISGNTKAYGGIHFSNGFTDMLSNTNAAGIKENSVGKYVELTLGILF